VGLAPTGKRRLSRRTPIWDVAGAENPLKLLDRLGVGSRLAAAPRLSLKSASIAMRVAMSARRKRKQVVAAVVLVEPETIAKALKVMASAVEG